ncbi:MAG: recombinase family protein [Parcubacteria group bacterium]
MALIGYARVSSKDQSYELQRSRLESAGCTVIRQEKVSGGSRKGRDELANILDFIREGDELVVTKLDRLGRSTRDVLNIVHELEGKGASLRVLEPEIVSTSGPMGRMVITVLGMVAELERSFIRERQQEGIEAAKQAGIYKGRRKKVRPEIRTLADEGLGPTAIAKRLGISRMTVYRELAGN